jgi:hypothetical protein
MSDRFPALGSRWLDGLTPDAQVLGGRFARRHLSDQWKGCVMCGKARVFVTFLSDQCVALSTRCKASAAGSMGMP